MDRAQQIRQNPSDDILLKQHGKGCTSTHSACFTNPICFNNETFSDVQIRINKDDYKVFFAHKVVLVARSEYFKCLFMDTSTSSNIWKENLTGLVDLHVEENIEDIFEDFLQYFYSGQITLSKGHIWPWYFLADQYLMDGLSELVKNYIRKYILKEDKLYKGKRSFTVLTNFSVEDAIDLATYFDDTMIRSYAGSVILKNLDKIGEANFQQLPKEVVLACLDAKTLSDPGKTPYGNRQHSNTGDMLGADLNEYALYKKILQWLDASPSRRALAEELLKEVRFGRFQTLVLLREASRHKYIVKSMELSRTVALVVQELCFANHSRPGAEQLNECQQLSPNYEFLKKQFEPRVANENAAFSTGRYY